MGAELLVMAAVFAVSLAASILLRPKLSSGALAAQTPTTVSERGSWVPWVLGRRRLGPVFLWAGDRQAFSMGSAGTGWKEAGWHALCVGPVWRLHSIRENGKVIWQGPIDPNVAPSGTTITTSGVGTFTIYWGTADQPVNTFLGAAHRVGIASRWPFLCYVVWNKKVLGSAPLWPQLEYDVEVRPFESGLVKSSSWFSPGKTLQSVKHKVVGAVNGPPGVAKIKVLGGVAKVYSIGKFLLLQGNSASGEYEVLTSSVANEVVLDPDTGALASKQVTTITLANTLFNANATGTVQVYEEGSDDGVNLAHALYQVFHSPFPHGVALSKSTVHLDSFESLGALCETERLLGSLHAADGTTAQAVAAQILTELGSMLPFVDGAYRLSPIRKPSDAETVPHLTDELLLPPLPETTNLLADRPNDRLVFAFRDRAVGYRRNVIPIDDDSQQTQTRSTRAATVEITTVVDYASAQRIAERRSQEGLAGNAVTRIVAARGARGLLPGHPITVSGLSGRWRVTAVELRADEGRVSIDALPDHYGSGPLSTFTGGAPPPSSEVLLPEADPVFQVIEVPPQVSLTPGVMAVLTPRVRAKIGISSADLLLSSSGVTYDYAASLTLVVAGGKLLEPVPGAPSSALVESFASFIAEGPDIASVQDLSGDEAEWRRGRQWLVIEDEILFLKRLVPLGNNRYRCEGVLRARLGSALVAHDVGAPLTIFRAQDAEQITDLSFAPNVTRYFKSLPKVGGDSLDPADAAPVAKFLRAPALVPARPENLRTPPLFANSFPAGGSLSLAWDYRRLDANHTGAGYQGAGGAVVFPPPPGSFTLRLLQGSVQKFVAAGLTTPSFTVSNPVLVAAFGSEPSTVNVQVTHWLGGYASPVATLTVVRV